MASINDLRTSSANTGMGNASGTDDGTMVIENPNVRASDIGKKHPSQSSNPNVQGAKLAKPAPAQQEEQQVKKAKRVAADLSVLPREERSENIHESIEDDILKEGGPFEKYVEKKTAEMLEVNRLIDEHNEQVAIARGEEVPTDEQLEELAKTGQATADLTAAIKGTKYYDQSDAYGRATGDIKSSPLEERMAADPALREEYLGTQVEESEASESSMMADDDDYVDPLEKEIEEEMSAGVETPVVPTRPARVEQKPSQSEKIVEAAKNPPVEKPSVNVDDDDIDLEIDPEDANISSGIVETVSEVDSDENMKQFQAEISKKIIPVKKRLNLSGFKVINTPISISAATLQASSRTAVDWCLPNSGQHISMREFSGKEMEQLNDRQGANDFQGLKNRFKLLYDHVTSPKPDDLEKWLKSVSYQDTDHLYFAAYAAGFSGSYFVPYDCDKCKNTFLSDSFSLENLYKYKDDDSKEKCEKLRASQDGFDPNLYVTEAIQFTDDFAISFREPSIWNAFFENTILDSKFTDKYRNILAIVMYIDNIWKIGDGSIQPIGYRIDNNNMAKTVKARTITYAKVLSTFTADQYNYIMACLNAINERSNDITYVHPEVVCPHCGKTIPESETSAEELLFTRSQLAALSLTSIS